VSARECILESVNAERNLSEGLAASDRAIAEHPGFQEYLELEALKRSLMAVFMPNLRELLGLLRAASTNPELAFELVQNVREPVVRDRFHDELTQRLHNYAASAQSLVELVRHLLANREGPIVDDFERRKQKVLLHGEVPFMKCLRNYMLHETLPFFAHTLSVKDANTPDAKMESEVELNVADLLRSDYWNTPARAFLEAQGERVILRPIVYKHSKLVFHLNSALYTELSKANAASLAEANELIVARNAILTGGDIEEAKRISRLSR
jgi:hypothetical protein